MPTMNSPYNVMLERAVVEAWLAEQKSDWQTIAEYFEIHIMKPDFAWWTMRIVCISYSLWLKDSTLRLALDVARAFVEATHYTAAQWPVVSLESTRYHWHDIITASCISAGIDPPRIFTPAPRAEHTEFDPPF